MSRPGGRNVALIIVRVSIDVVGIRARFARERPPVADDDWNAQAYVDERIAAYREALHAQDWVQSGVAQMQLIFDTGAADGDRIAVSALDSTVGGEPTAAMQAIAQAAQRVARERGAWRRHLSEGYFERHRAWRRVAGGPITH